MTPKTHFSIPLNKTTAATTPTQRGRKVTHTTESIPLDRVTRRAASSVCRPCAPKGEASGPADATIETYPLHFIEPESDLSDEEPNTMEDNDHASDVSLLRSSCSDSACL
jgi:hypothetical protein